MIFDSPTVVVFQRTDDSFADYGATVDLNSRSLTMTKGGSKSWTARFTVERPAQDRLILDGDMDNHKIHVQLTLVEFDSFRLLNSGFRWIRPPDPSGGYFFFFFFFLSLSLSLSLFFSRIRRS